MLIAKISYDYCEITGFYSMSGFIAFVTVVYKHSTNRCNFKNLLSITHLTLLLILMYVNILKISLDDNYQEVVITQWYCSYHPVLSFDIWLHWNRINCHYIIGLGGNHQL